MMRSLSFGTAGNIIGWFFKKIKIKLKLVVPSGKFQWGEFVYLLWNVPNYSFQIVIYF